MSSNNHRNNFALICVCFLPLLAGCQVLDVLHCPPEGEKFLGTVRTGGPLATAKTLPIPLEGLTLSRAVELSIRPGLQTPTSGISNYAAPVQQPVDETPVDSTNMIKATVNKITQEVGSTFGDVAIATENAINAAVPELASLGDGSPETESRIKTVLDAAGLAGLFDINADIPDRQTKTQKLYDDLANAIQPPPVNPYPQSAPTAALPPSELIAVQLTRPDGRRLVVPLQMVRSYSPGDIWLVDGDRVFLMPLAITEAGQDLPGRQSVPVSNFDSSESPATNLLVLTHTSVLDGHKEQYLLPAPNQQYYGGATFVSQWLNQTFVHSGDQLQAGTLELNPLIRNSQLNSVAASAAIVKERMDPSIVTLSDKIHQKLQKGKDIFHSLPVVRGMHKQVEQQIGPVTLAGALQQSTGFNAEDFVRHLNP